VGGGIFRMGCLSSRGMKRARSNVTVITSNGTEGNASVPKMTSDGHASAARVNSEGNSSVTRTNCSSSRRASHSRSLYEAAYNGRFCEVKRFLDSGVDPDESDDNGSTPLMAASRFGYIGIAELLIEKGADINAQNSWGWTALQQACNGKIDVIKYLLSKGANPNLNDHDNISPLFILSEFGDGEKEVEGIKLLIAAGANINNQCYGTILEEKKGATPLLVAAWNSRYNNVLELLRSGADPNICNISGRTPYDLAGKNTILCKKVAGCAVSKIRDALVNYKPAASAALEPGNVLGWWAAEADTGISSLISVPRSMKKTAVARVSSPFHRRSASDDSKDDMDNIVAFVDHVDGYVDEHKELTAAVPETDAFQKEFVSTVAETDGFQNGLVAVATI
jgi:ankyrin repeat protein